MTPSGTLELATQLATEPYIAAAQHAASLVIDTADADEPDRPDLPHAAYYRMQPRWEKCRDCFMGTERIRAGRTKYVPQHAAESDPRYEVRHKLAAFHNGFARMVLAAVGLLLETPIAFGKDMPPELVTLAENIDNKGTHINVFARRLFLAGLTDGYAGILVEYARQDRLSLFQRAKASLAAAAGGPLSADDEDRMGLRPYFLLFRVDDVFKPVFQTVNGVSTRVLQVFREIVQERVGIFGSKRVTQYRVYTNTAGVIRYQLWRSPDGVAQPEPTPDTRVPVVIKNQTEIPWQPFYAGEEVPGATDEWKPALLDLADVNIQFHNTLTNMLSLEAQAMIPTPVRLGAKPTYNEAKKVWEYPPLILGPGNTIEIPWDATDSPLPPQPVYWLAPPTDVLAAGEKTLDRTLETMASMGAAFLQSEPRQTAEGKRIDNAAQRATLSSTGEAGQDCLEGAFGFAANYRKIEGGSVTVNKNFTGEGIDATFLQVCTQAYLAGALSMQEYRTALHTGQLPEDFNSQAVAALIGAQLAKAALASANAPSVFP